MQGGTTVGKLVVGPDMQDCSVFLAEMMQEQDCNSSVLMEPAGYVGGSHWRVSVVSTSRDLTPDGPAWSVATTELWPQRSYTPFPVALFSQLYRHDVAVTTERVERGELSA